MNRILLCLALVLALVNVQALSLHAHLGHAHDQHATADHHRDMHVHSHAVGAQVDADNEHADTVVLDLFSSTLSRDHITPSLSFVALTSLLLLIFAIVWTCIRRRSLFILIPHYRPPQYRTSSPRAPPF